MLLVLLSACLSVDVRVPGACVETDALELAGLPGLEGFGEVIEVEQRLHDGPIDIPTDFDSALWLETGALVAEEGDFGFTERVELSVSDGEKEVNVLCYDRRTEGPADAVINLVAEPVELTELLEGVDLQVDLRLAVHPDQLAASFSFTSEVCLSGHAGLQLGWDQL